MFWKRQEVNDEEHPELAFYITTSSSRYGAPEEQASSEGRQPNGIKPATG